MHKFDWFLLPFLHKYNQISHLFTFYKLLNYFKYRNTVSYHDIFDSDMQYYYLLVSHIITALAYLAYLAYNYLVLIFIRNNHEIHACPVKCNFVRTKMWNIWKKINCWTLFQALHTFTLTQALHMWPTEVYNSSILLFMVCELHYVMYLLYTCKYTIIIIIIIINGHWMSGESWLAIKDL